MRDITGVAWVLAGCLILGGCSQKSTSQSVEDAGIDATTPPDLGVIADASDVVRVPPDVTDAARVLPDVADTGLDPEDVLPDGADTAFDTAFDTADGSPPLDEGTQGDDVDPPPPDVQAPPPTSCPGEGTESVAITIAPYIQLAKPESVWILWETSSGVESRVDFGPTDALGQIACGLPQTGYLGSKIHEAKITGLSPGSAYHYRVQTQGSQSAIHRFVTPPSADSEASFRLVGMSDSQIDFGNPDVFSNLINNGVIPFITEQFTLELEDELGLVLFPGDLVQWGWFYDQWRDHFFGPAASLFSRVPVYPVLGNHEDDTDYFFALFRLPDNGTSGYEEHWWFHDYSNLRVIGLDSNGDYRIQEQLDWLQDVLNDACQEPTIDFVFAQLHHPHKSELWLDGEIDYTGEVIAALEDFTSLCGKPSIHFFGHTHGYSRGQSRDHRHLWVNVASAGGNLDDWGEYAQADYEEFTVTQPEHGFVVVDVMAGDDPQFHLRRISLGTPDNPLENVERDSIAVRRTNNPPDTPVPVAPAGSTACGLQLTMMASAYFDVDGDPHGASHWQVSTKCDDFSNLLYERWRQHENWFFGEDLQLGDSLVDEIIPSLAASESLCWRVRFRDQALAWSEWSTPATFSVTGAETTANLLSNPGAEDGVTVWAVIEGVFEALTDGECTGGMPYSGNKYFAVGGLCNESEYAEAHQTVTIDSTHYDAIDAGGAVASMGGYLSDFNGNDRPEINLIFLDAQQTVLGATEPLGTQQTEWTWVGGDYGVPAATRSMTMVLTGTRHAGTDNDSYMDDLMLRLHSCN
jgi:hypothetical protein